LKRVIEQYGRFECTLREIDTLMERYDKNGDGTISYSEFS
jgi:Ca2+-binding EF-hand superfamily protein